MTVLVESVEVSTFFAPAYRPKRSEVIETLKYRDPSSTNEILKAIIETLPGKASPTKRVYIFPLNDKYAYTLDAKLIESGKKVAYLTQYHLHGQSEGPTYRLVDQCKRYVRLIMLD